MQTRLLTERKFQELYQEALKARAIGNHAAARDRLLYLFDHGRTVGGFGVTRLSFVLHELSGLAEPESRSRGREAQQTLNALQQRRDRREALVRQGQAGFTEIQELLALNRALAEPRRSLELYRELECSADPSPDLAAERQTFASLLPEEIPLVLDAETLFRQYQLETLKRRMLELQSDIESRLANPSGDCGDGISTVALRTDVEPLLHLKPRPGEEDEKLLTALAREVWDLLSRYPLPPSGGDPRASLEGLQRELARLINRFDIREDRLRDREILGQMDRVAREVALLICELRVDQDFPDPEMEPPEGYQSSLEERIRKEGLVAYEVLLRAGQSQKAETLESWLLSCWQDRQMYDDLRAAVSRAGKDAVHDHLHDHLEDEARRLQI